MERARQGDREAFGVLLRAHLDTAMRLARRVLHSVEDAEDAVHDGFLLALQRLDQFDASRPFGPWLSRIVVNRSIDLAESRRVRTTEPLDDRAPDDGADALTQVESNELTDRVRAIAKSMPPRQRLIVELHDVEDWTVAEIAGLTGSSSATVRWHLHMGRRALRAALTPLYGKDN